MEKMNQVSVSEFMANSKEEMYDMAVNMVEKYNRLVDICRETYNAEIEDLKKELDGCKATYYASRTQLDVALAKKNEEIEKLKKERDKQMARVSDLRMELDCVKASKEKHEEAAHDKLVKDLRDNINYWRTECNTRNTEIETLKTQVNNLEKELEEKNKYKEYWESQYNYALKCHEEDVDEICRLKDENSYLKKECKDKNDIIKKAYDRYADEACKGREEIMNECYEKLTKDDTGYIGFKKYSLRALEAQEGDEKKAKDFLCKSVDVIFYDKKAEKERKEEETVKYKPSEIDRFTDFLKDEVDKKSIVDISFGVEDDLCVTRELLDIAVKLIVARGYHEYEGVVTGYGEFHVLTTPNVKFKDIYDTWKIKSIVPDIPCGSDAIE